MGQKRVLIIYYSYTRQTKRMLDKFVAGLETEGVEVTLQRLIPLTSFAFPIGTYGGVFKAAVKTFFKVKISIEPIGAECYGNWDKVIIAGPTWSYFPCGPILDFIGRFGEEICSKKDVVPFISCRSFWRIHFWTLRKRLRRCGARVEAPFVFTHPGSEPWRTIALVLVLKGEKAGASTSWFRRHFKGYGHSKKQGLIALEKGVELARALNKTEEDC